MPGGIGAVGDDTGGVDTGGVPYGGAAGAGGCGTGNVSPACAYGSAGGWRYGSAMGSFTAPILGHPR
ncbi:hypothetical protein GCM10009682_61280 [Luedemannella flava]|uniref:Uncharacterized protein n=1 Tax=Luedemannella flava TaxID=349316 RepID=A0ABP4Z1L6_9ACTN